MPELTPLGLLIMQVARMMMAEEALDGANALSGASVSDWDYLGHCQEKVAEAALKVVVEEEKSLVH